MKIFYSTFASFEVEALSKEDAILKAREIPVKKNEILNNLQNLEEIDEAIEANYEESSKQNPL